MLSDKEINTLIKFQLIKIRNELDNKINKLEGILLDPKKSANERMTMLATTLMFEKEKLEGDLKLH